MKSLSNLGAPIALLTLLVIGCACPDAKQNNRVDNAPAGNTSQSQPTNTQDKAAPTEIKITAKQLTSEYEKNEIAADEKYSGKTLVVTGKIENIAETFGTMQVQIEGHKMLINVMCRFSDSERASVSKLSKGSTVTVVGTGDGFTAGLYVGLTDCKIR